MILHCLLLVGESEHRTDLLQGYTPIADGKENKAIHLASISLSW